MRFLHTADWQLGCNFSSLRNADALRKARLEAVKKIFALAEKQSVDFIIAAGDLLEHNLIENWTIEQMAQIVSASPVPIYLLPGNHDPLVPDSPYVRKPDMFGKNAVILRDESPIKLTGGTLYPCPLRTRRSRLDPTSWIPKREPNDGIRIGVAHGSAGISEPDDFPIDVKATELHELDYLALGHWHGRKEINARTWYCGTPEPTRFDELPGYVLLVEIDSQGSLPKVTEISVATHKWLCTTEKVYSEKDVDALMAKVISLQDPRTLLDLKIEGTLAPPELARVESLNGEHFCELRLTCDVSPAMDEIKFHHPLLNEMVRYLQTEVGSSGEQAHITRRAIAQLTHLVREAGFQKENI